MKKCLICAIFFVFTLFSVSYGENIHYGHLEQQIGEFYRAYGVDVQIEPSGPLDADVIGKGADQRIAVVAEIKKATELERSWLLRYWSQWNSLNQKHGGKPLDFKLSSVYSDGAESVSPEAKGFLAVIDGQLRRSYMEGRNRILGSGDLILENYTDRIEKDLHEALEYLKKEGRIKGYEIKINSEGTAFIRIHFDKLSFKAIYSTYAQLASAKLRLTNKSVASESARGTNMSSTVENIPLGFSKILKQLVKWSVAVGIIVSGYSVTKEIYDRKMSGQEVHPSRVMGRAVVGFLGAFALAALLGAVLGLVPGAGPVLAVFGVIIGGVVGAIVSEWLFELIIPYNGTGWAILDFLFGGVLGGVFGGIFGAIMGAFVGFHQGLWDAGRSNDGGFLKDIFKLTILDPVNAIGGSVVGTIGGAIGGFFFGGFVGSLLFWFLFNMM